MQRLFSVRNLLSAHVSDFFCEDSLKIHFDFDRHQFLLQLFQTCVDSRLICTSTTVTLKVHGCRWTNLPAKVNHVSELYALNRTLLAPVTLQ